MTPADYDYLCELLMETSGLHLGPSKQYLITSRLVPLAQSWGLDDIPELVAQLKRGDTRLTVAVTEAMTTNETSFFRDGKPFESLREKILPKLIEERKTSRSIRIWCAASSTGQEPYSIAMVLKKHFPELDTWRVEIVATDIAHKMVDRTRAGVFSQMEVQRGLAIQDLIQFFDQGENHNEWRAKDELRSMIRCSQLNLLDPFQHLGRFDIVFCRNVLIYFDVETKKDILERIRDRMPNDGHLLLGAAETVIGIYDGYERADMPGAVYKPKVGTPVGA